MTDAAAGPETSATSPSPTGAADAEKPTKPRRSSSGDMGLFATITGEEAEKLKAKHKENDPTTAAEMIANSKELPREFKLGTKVVHSSKGLGVIVFLQEDFPPKVFVQFPCTCQPVKCDGTKHLHGYKATSWHKLTPQAGQGWSRLASLVQGGQVKAVRKLVRDAQADELGEKQLQAWLQEVDQIGYTVLHWAIGEGGLSSNSRSELTELMLEAKADPNAATPSGNTPLMLASRHAQPALVRMLLEVGAETDARNASGASALHAAANSASPDCVRLLIEAGSDLKQPLHGRRPLQLARERAGHLREAAAEAAADYALRKRRGQIREIDESEEVDRVGDAEALAKGAAQCEKLLRIAWRKLKRAEGAGAADDGRSRSGVLGDAAGDMLSAAAHAIEETAHAVEHAVGAAGAAVHAVEHRISPLFGDAVGDACAPTAAAAVGSSGGSGTGGAGGVRGDSTEGGPAKQPLAAPGAGGPASLWRLVACPGRVTPCLAWGRDKSKP